MNKVTFPEKPTYNFTHEQLLQRDKILADEIEPIKFSEIIYSRFCNLISSSTIYLRYVIDTVHFNKSVELYDKGIELIALPDDHYNITSMIDYDSPVLGKQHARLENIEEFEDEIASSRTFCFLHELEFLAHNNLIKGGLNGF